MFSQVLRGALLVTALLVQGVVAEGPARAADDPAEALLRRGAELRRADRHEEALELFQKAHAISPSGRTLGQMGLAEFSLKRYVDAEAHLVGALADQSPWVAKNRGALEQALEDVRKHVAVLTISGPAGADVTVNGKPVGRLPLVEPVHVGEGRVRIEGNLIDHQTTAVDIKAPGGQQVNTVLDLVPIAPPVAAPGLSSPSGSGASMTEASLRWRTWAGGGLLAVSAAALATGIVWIAIDGNAACTIPPGAPAGSRCMYVYDTKTPGLITAGAGVAAGIAGGVLLWKGRAGDVQVGLAPGRLTAVGHF
jgi:hypothetical protein